MTATRKVVLTSAGAETTRSQYVPSTAVVDEEKKTNQTERAKPARAAERSEAMSYFPPAYGHGRRGTVGFPERCGRAGGHAGMHATREATRKANRKAWAENPRNANNPQHRTLDSATSVDTLLGQAGKLSKQERQDLLDRLALENVRPTASRDLDMWSLAVARALEGAIGASGGEAYGQMLCKRQLGLSSTWKPIDAFMHSSGLAALPVVERQAVYNLLADLMVEAAGTIARRAGVSLSLKLTAQQTGQVGGIFERAFPGYIAAGLAPVVARQSLRS